MNRIFTCGSQFFFVLSLSLFVTTGCSTMPSPPPSPDTVYSDSGVRKGNVSSYDKFTGTRVFEYSYDDVFEATKTALFRKGFDVSRADKKAGLILAHGSVMRREMIGVPIPFTASAKIIVVDRKPRTRLTVNADSYWDIYFGGAVRFESSANHLGNELMADIQKVLTTY